MTSPSFWLSGILILLGTCVGCDNPAATTPDEARGRSAKTTQRQPPVTPPKETNVPGKTGPQEPPSEVVPKNELGSTDPRKTEDPSEEKKDTPPEAPPPIPTGAVPFPKDSKVLFFEKTADDRRRVHLLAEVCLREGPLEVLLCKKNTKEHEAIMRVDADARDIHFALIAAKATPGTTVKFQPKYQPATGSTIKVTLTYNLNGKLRTEPAQNWIKDLKTKREMRHDWVFAGSRFFKFPDEPERAPYYCANNGEVISIANFPDSMLDLPVMSPREQADLAFEAWTERIPPLKTQVLITLEPVVEEKKK